MFGLNRSHRAAELLANVIGSQGESFTGGKQHGDASIGSPSPFVFESSGPENEHPERRRKRARKDRVGHVGGPYVLRFLRASNLSSGHFERK